MGRVHASVTSFGRINVLIEFKWEVDKELRILPERVWMFTKKLTMGICTILRSE